MISKNEVKYIQSLSDKKNRDHLGVFVAEGPKLIGELLDTGLNPQTIYTANKTVGYDKNDLPVKEITSADLQRISQFDKANSAIGVFYKKTLPPLFLNSAFTLALGWHTGSR